MLWDYFQSLVKSQSESVPKYLFYFWVQQGSIRASVIIFFIFYCCLCQCWKDLDFFVDHKDKGEFQNSAAVTRTGGERKYSNKDTCAKFQSMYI